jgi:hypothetical protein
MFLWEGALFCAGAYPESLLLRLRKLPASRWCAIRCLGHCGNAGLQDPDGEVLIHSSSAQVLRGFCAICGTALTYRHDLRIDEIDFTLASLVNPMNVAPERHIWVQDKLPWSQINDGLPQFLTVTGHIGA